MALTVEQLERLLRMAQEAITLQEKRIEELEAEVRKLDVNAYPELVEPPVCKLCDEPFDPNTAWTIGLPGGKEVIICLKCEQLRIS